MKILTAIEGSMGDTVMMPSALSDSIQYNPDAEITLLICSIGNHLLKNFHINIAENWTWQHNEWLKLYIDKAGTLKPLLKFQFNKFFYFDSKPHIAALFSNTKVEPYWHHGLGDYGLYMQTKTFTIVRLKGTTSREKCVSTIDLNTVFDTCKKFFQKTTK